MFSLGKTFCQDIEFRLPYIRGVLLVARGDPHVSNSQSSRFMSEEKGPLRSLPPRGEQANAMRFSIRRQATSQGHKAMISILGKFGGGKKIFNM